MAFQPWKANKQLLIINRKKWLQWSHGFSAMERNRKVVGEVVTGYCFNGAMAFQPWKALVELVLMFPELGFNGAMAFQPWKELRSFADQINASLLQWSHGFSAMERVEQTRG